MLEQHIQTYYSVDLSESKPIDIKAALDKHNQDRAALSSKLSDYETKSIDVCLSEIAKSIDKGDLFTVQKISQTLCDTSGYIGARRISFICWCISIAFHSDEKNRMFELYTVLIESVIQLKRFSWKFSVEGKGKVKFNLLMQFPFR